MGKNTMIKKAVKDLSEEHERFEALLPIIRGNVGFVFTNDSDLKAVRDIITSNRVRAPAKAGAGNLPSLLIDLFSLCSRPR